MNLPGAAYSHGHAVSILAWLQQDATIKLAITTALLAACVAASLWLTRHPPDHRDQTQSSRARRLLPAALAIPAVLLAALFVYIAVTSR